MPHDAAPPPRPTMAALGAMFLVAGAILVMQVAFSRVLSVIASYHAAFLVASLAMLGLTASAIDAYARKVKHPDAFGPDHAARAAGRAALGLTASLFVLLEAGRWESISSLGVLIGVFGVLFTFHQGGYVIAWLLDHYAADVSRVYFVDLVGAATGCVVAVLLLGFLPAPVVMLACGAAIATGGVLLATDKRLPAFGAAVALTATLMGTTTPLFQVHRAKDQSQHDILWERWNRLARVTVVPETPGLAQAVALLRRDRTVSEAEIEQLAGSWRLGWGASRNHTGPVPNMMWIQLDADAGTPIIEGGTTADLGFLEWDVTSAAHHLRKGRIDRSFVIGGGGGRDILTALQFGAKQVDVVEINPSVVEVVRHGFPDVVRAPPYDDPRVSLTLGEGRSVLASTEGRYDVIQMSLVDTWAASMAGAMVLSENTLYTQEAFDAYVAHLDDDGVLSISRWYDPPSWEEASALGNSWAETARVVRLSATALANNGIDHPEDHIALVYARGYLGAGVCTVVTSRAPLDDDDRAALQRLVDVQGFGVLWPPPADGTTPVEDHGWDVEGVLTGDETVLAHPQFDLATPTDERPFFFNVRRPLRSWVDAAFAWDHRLGSQATLVFAVALALLGLVGGVLVTRPLRELEVRAPLVPALYFGGIGVGFMAIEMALIQRYIVFLGHPTYALSVVLASLLLGSGIGSGLTSRVRSPERAIPVIVGLVIAATLLSAFALPPLLLATLSQPLPVRVALAVAGILPQALCMGTLWPLGVRLLIARGLGAATPWMWATNGFLGVLASVFAVFLATLYGYTAVLALAAVAYAMTGLASRMRWT
ncbi:MAG: hypothetical protein H6738_01175 [Alphaproteobacteria bacterium]|nr:hypothetical protein [Alphaproteobacteria bacterium]